MKERPGIMMYFERWAALLELPDARVGAFCRAALKYGKDGVQPEFQGAEAALWAIIRADIDRDGARYQEVSEARRRAAKARWSIKAFDPEQDGS